MTHAAACAVEAAPLESVHGVIAQLARDGIRLTVRAADGAILASPRDGLTDQHRALIRRYKPALLEVLSDEPPLPAWAEAALQTGDLVICARCCHFDPRPAQRPNGHCRRYDVETWANWSFRCEGYEVTSVANISGRCESA